MMEDMTIADNVQHILNNVDVAKAASSYSNQPVSVIAVTKYVDTQMARKVVEAGIRDIAENRTDLFLEKYHALSDLTVSSNLTWHLIGNLQRRKVKDVINLVDYFHALDSIKLAQEIDKRATHVIKCFLEINISGEESKHGFAVDEVLANLTELSNLEKVQIVGLMTMAPFDATEEECTHIFSQLKQVQLKISALNLRHIPCTELSMGMSRDYQIAIHEGATFVRIGHEFFRNVDL